jgi:hypothetical protein
VLDGALYACGTYSRYVTVSTGQRHGFGLVSKFDLTTGQERYHIGVGPDLVASGLNAACFSSGRFYGGGWTNSALVDGGTQAWFAEVDVTEPDVATSSELLEVPPIRSGEEALPASLTVTPGSGRDRR